MAELDRSAFHMINEAAWCGHNDLRAFAQAAQLPFHILATVNRQGLDRRMLGKVVDFFSDLYCQFTRRRENDRLNVFGCRSGHNFFQYGDAVCSRLAGTGLSLANHVFAGQCNRNRFCLDRGWFFKTHVIQCTDDLFTDI